jgi:hypothetical protein
MLAIALELAWENPTYENVASKFFEHFVYIAHAMDHQGGKGIELWDEDDGCYYDVLLCLDGRHLKMRVRSMVGLIPLFAVETLESDSVDRLPGFKRRMQWFIDNRPDFRDHVDIVEKPGGGVAAAALHRDAKRTPARITADVGRGRVFVAIRYSRPFALPPRPPLYAWPAGGGANQVDAVFCDH